jgi:quercetin dioxygenase-like cupin family protein
MAASVSAQAPGGARAAGPPELFRAALPDMPGKQLVVVALTIQPKRADQPPSPGHRHPGSVYVYVTQGTARFGVEGQPVKEVKTGESFFEPPGALHTVMESAHPTEPATAIAVMIVPDGAPLTLPARQ